MLTQLVLHSTLRNFFLAIFSAIPVITLTVATNAAIPERRTGLQPGRGTPEALTVGVFQRNLRAEPSSLNPITAFDGYTLEVHLQVLDTLLTRNLDTYAWEPSLAESWSVSNDNQEFTFRLRKNSVWSDGTPITSADVKFSFDAIMDDAYKAGHLRTAYENIARVEVIDDHSVKFVAKNRTYSNFDVTAGMFVWPKHVYGNAETALKLNKTVIGSGPYVLKEYRQGQFLLLERNPKWWGLSLDQFKGRYNAQAIRFKFDQEENLILERLKKGELDFDELTAESYSKKTSGGPWEITLTKTKIESLRPKGYRYVGWNLKNPLFSDVKTRRALAHLMNREEMNKKFDFGMSLLATGPWYRQSKYANPDTQPLLFDPKLAATLLKEAGWTDSNQDGVLERDGRKFEFTLIYARKDMQKYYVLYQEDLKKAGIHMKLQVLDWNALLKKLDEHGFEAVSLGWGGGAVDVDPKSIWHSDSHKVGGSNWIGYSNPKVDKLIDDARSEFNEERRQTIYRQVYSLIANDAPYVFLFNDRYELYASSKKMRAPKPGYAYDIGTDFWWVTQ